MNFVYVFWFFSGVVTSMILITSMPGSKVYEYDQAIEQCQKDLPRNVTCKITAVPNTKEEK